MNSNESRKYQMLQKVYTFGESHRDLFPVQSLGGGAFEVVGVAVRELAQHAASKMSAAREGRFAKGKTREELVSRLKAIAQSARVIARGEPGFGDAFHLPAPRTDQALVTTGRVFVTTGEAVKSRFIEYGMPDDFVTGLRAVVDEFERALKSREAGKDGTTLARASIEAALASGFEAVRKLDVIVPNRLGHDVATMEVWRRNRRVEPSRRSRKAVSSAAAATAPSAVDSAVTGTSKADVATPESVAAAKAVA